jgi:hypothetical protein
MIPDEKGVMREAKSSQPFAGFTALKSQASQKIGRDGKALKAAVAGSRAPAISRKSPIPKLFRLQSRRRIYGNWVR